MATRNVGKKEATGAPRFLQLSLGCDVGNPGAPFRPSGAGSEALSCGSWVLSGRCAELKRDFLS